MGKVIKAKEKEKKKDKKKEKKTVPVIQGPKKITRSQALSLKTINKVIYMTNRQIEMNSKLSEVITNQASIYRKLDDHTQAIDLLLRYTCDIAKCLPKLIDLISDNCDTLSEMHDDQKISFIDIKETVDNTYSDIQSMERDMTAVKDDIDSINAELGSIVTDIDYIKDTQLTIESSNVQIERLIDELHEAQDVNTMLKDYKMIDNHSS
jgi:uncharacterized phage infection (PIP) family protein YhgE